MLVGNISKFGESYLLNLKLIDVLQANVAGSISRTGIRAEEELLSETQDAVRELMRLSAPRMGVTLAPEGPPEAGGPGWFELELHASLFGGLGAGRWVDGGGGAGHTGAGELTGDRLGGGLRVGARLLELHTVFLNFDYLVEHWTGTDTVEAGGAYRLGLDFHVLRLAAGYRFAYPVLTWLAPFAEASLGVNLMLPKTLDLAGGQSVEYQPEGGTRFAALLGLGVRFTVLERWIGSVYYLWDIPVTGLSSSSIVVGLGARI
jgi:hypothetical protein